MNKRRPVAACAAALLLGLAATLPMPAAADWRCRQGRVELIVGGTQGCVEAPRPAASAESTAPRQREQERRAILEAELRQEQATLAALQDERRAPDPAAQRRVRENIDALQRELVRPGTGR